MDFRRTAIGIAAASFILLTAATAYACSYSLEKTTRVTYVKAKSRTTRSNGQCIAVDAGGTAHLAWEDDRHMNREVYYASIAPGGEPREIRISRTPAESSFPCIASDSLDTYILWEEVIGLYSEIMYARIRDGKVAVSKRLTRTYLDSSCPVSVLGPDGSLHIAWHEGPFKQTAIYYGRVESDSLVEKLGVCTKYPEAFRPAISCDGDGRIMLIWPEGDRMSSRLYNGSEWEERKLIAGLEYIPWRVSVAGLPDGRWAAAWFDGRNDTNRVYVGFYEGDEWQDPELLAGDELATSYYPDLAVGESGDLVAVYESRVPSRNYCTIHTRCYDGRTWSDPVEVYRHRAPGRYASIAFHDGVLHSIWFSLMQDSDEIYYSTMRSDR
jgi:hypothetical protein